MNRDKSGALGQIQDGHRASIGFPVGSIEGGDAVNFSGQYYYLTECNLIIGQSFVSFFEVEPGLWCRHPDTAMTYYGFGADTRSISRDQICGILSGIIAADDKPAMKRFIKDHAKRGFLQARNTIHNGVDPKTAKTKWYGGDLTGPEILAQEIRGLKPGWYDKLLPLLDLHMLLNTYWINQSEGNECISYLIKLFISVEHKPTWVSRLSLMKVDQLLMHEKLKSYWGATGDPEKDWRQQPEMVLLYLKKLLGLQAKEIIRIRSKAQPGRETS